MAESFGVTLASSAGFTLPLSTVARGVELFVSTSATHVHKRKLIIKLTTKYEQCFSE